MQKHSKESRRVHSPKILSPVSVQPNKACMSGEGPASGIGLMPNSSQNYLLGRKHLSFNYRSLSGSNKHKHYARSKDKKKAIREFNKEVQSAVLPDIGSALTSFKSRALKFEGANSHERHYKQHYATEGCSNIDLQYKEKKHVEYLHDDVEEYDSNNKRKWVWTFFNKAVVEGEPE